MIYRFASTLIFSRFFVTLFRRHRLSHGDQHRDIVLDFKLRRSRMASALSSEHLFDSQQSFGSRRASLRNRRAGRPFASPPRVTVLPFDLDHAPTGHLSRRLSRLSPRKSPAFDRDCRGAIARSLIYLTDQLAKSWL